MGLICPACSLDSLTITSKIELPPNERSDEVTLQLIECKKCGFQGVAVYEESRRGKIDSDTFSHRGYTVSSELLNKIKEMINHCPDQNNARCRCKTHRHFIDLYRAGNWDWLEEHRKNKSFEIRYKD
jgi:hypothetical protein